MHFENYNDSVINLSLHLDGTMVYVSKMQKKIAEYNVQWMTNGVFPVLLDYDHLCHKKFKLGKATIVLLNQAWDLYASQQPDANRKGSHKMHQ
jgi:hypothetical protein